MAKAKILVVEDDRFYTEFYLDILGKEGFRVETARNGREAMRRLEEASFDLLIADVVLKDASGLELLAEIKKTHPSQDVIMVTSMQSIRRAVEALKLGASDYLTKPVDREELLLAIQKVLDRQVVSQEHTKLISENIHFYELLRIQKKILSLFSVSDLDKLKDLLLDVVIQEANAPGALLFMRDAMGRYRLETSRGLFETRGESLDLVFRSGILQEALESGRPLLESQAGDQWEPKSGDEGYRLILPISSRQEVLGAVKLVSRKSERPYGAFDIDLARHILEAAGMALRNAMVTRDLSERQIRGLTAGTYAPSSFKAFTEIQMNVAKRYNREVALILLSLYNFRQLQQRFKENQVEQVLDLFCRAVLEVIRETDLLARLGEDLFGIIVPETDYYGALMLKKRIKARLAKVTYPVDMKKEFTPVVHIGCTACPKDGGNYQNLVEVARRRLEEDQKSIYHHLKLEGADFWGIVNHLIDPTTIEAMAKGHPEKASNLRAIQVTEAGVQSLLRSMLKDLSKFYSSRGLLYLGVGTADPEAPFFAEAGPQESYSVSVFVLGAKGPKSWNLPYLTPVFINDPALSKHLFALGLTEEFTYALFCRRDGGETMSGFHSSDHLLVMEMITRLQERYLLQRRIG